MFDEFLKKADELVLLGESFAIATVVRYEAPISGKPGDKAIIFADGEIWGWIGGGCARPAVVKEALKALQDGRPRLVHISPTATEEAGIVAYNMSCHSGGTLDVYIEPVLPKPHVLIMGRSPVGQTLARLAKVINYTVSVAAPEDNQETYPEVDRVQAGLELKDLKMSPHTFIVVSTQGECDEEALENALRTDVAYVAFVASKAKAAKVLEYLGARGVSAERLRQVRAPAGIDIGASSPEEIAVSILAQIVQLRRSQTARQETPAIAPVEQREAKDPVCGMSVSAGAAKHKSEYDGKAFTSVAPPVNRNSISNRICLRLLALPRDLLPVHYLAAIHVDGLTGDLTAPLRREEHHHVCDILWLLPSGEGRYCPHFIVCPIVVGSPLGGWLLIVPRLPDAFVQRRAHHARTNHVDANSMRRQIFCQALREVDVGRFACAVRGVCLGADLPGYRS
jgi:xanthine dehydrogenase accessory factor